MTDNTPSQEAREAAELLPTVTDALLPCPFCGSPAELSDLGDPQDDSMVNCTNQRGCGMQQIARFTPEGAVAAWNTRARPQDTDRGAAKALLDQLAVRFHRDGTFRDWDNTVAAFARHREQAERDTLARQQTGGGEEWVTISARDGIEAQHGLNDIFPGDPVQVKASRLLADVDLTLRHARTFITSRQKMHPDGITLYDEQIEAVSAALSGEGRNGG